MSHPFGDLLSQSRLAAGILQASLRYCERPSAFNFVE